MKFNHFCLIAGIFLIVLSISVFANAACANTSDSACSACISNLYSNPTVTTSACGTPPTCGSNPTSPCPAPVCGTTLNSCTRGNFFDVSDSSTQYIWSCKDNTGASVCCTLNKPCTGICGNEVNTCEGGNFVDMNDSSTQLIWGCAGLSTTTTCTANRPIDPCVVDLPPYFLEIPNQTITYKENISIDLWDYVKDSDDFQNELNIDVFVSAGNVGNLDFIDCEIVSNRYFECSVNGIGEMAFSIGANDSCGKSVYSNYFSINVTNSAPRISITDKAITCTQNLTQLIDLYDYSADEDKQLLDFNIISQSNPYFANCYILPEDHYISCSLASCNAGVNDIRVRTTDIFGLSAESTFRLSVLNNAPVWKEINSVCINDSKTKFIDLRNYVSDTEDKNNLFFSLTQSNLNGLTCSIVDSNFISCTLSSNQKLVNTLDLNAMDSKGKSSSTRFIVSSNCFDTNYGSISFQAETYGVCLEKCSTYSLPITIANDTNERKCFDFDSRSSPYNYLDTFVSPGEFCLNKGEESKIILSANSCTAEERRYDVSVFDKDSDLSMDFKFEVGTCTNFDGFRVEEFDGTICQGEKKEFSVLVTNTSTVKKKIYLSAENEMILPHFNEEYVVLEGRSSEYVSLMVNAIALKEGTTEVVSISADGEDYHIQKELYFDVVNCSEVIKSTFDLSVPSVCFDVRRGQTLESQFTIRRETDGSNCSTKTKDFFLGIAGASSELSYDKVSLKLGESKTIVYSIVVPSDLAAGRNYVTVNANDGDEWNSFTQSKDVCLNVLAESNSSFYVRTQSKDIIWCGSNVFEVEVVNNGDLDETYSLSTIEVPIGVNVNFSEERFTVRKGESKIIYVSVSTNTTSRVADNQKIQLRLNGSTQLTSTIYFNIKEKTTFDDIQILSSTAEINMNGNSSAPFDLLIRNNSEKDLNQVIISIESLPEGVEFDTITVNLLKAGQSMKVEGRITAGDVNGTFAPVFVVSSTQLVNKKEFVLNIEKNEGVFSGLFTGLFSFGANPFSLGGLENGGLFGLFILAVILIVLVWIITLGVLSVSKTKKQKEVWME